MELIQPFQKDQAFLDDVNNARKEIGKLHIWWLGQSGFLIQFNEFHLLIDPYLSDALTKKYQFTTKPHVRMTELVISPGKLNFIDLVTSSHNHTDHLDGETLMPLIDVNPDIAFVVPEANRAFASDRIRRPIDFPIGLKDGETKEVKGVKITGVPAAHNKIDRDLRKNCFYMGFVFQIGPWTIYHSGDTIWHDTIINALKPFKIDIALLPINGNDPKRKVPGNLNGQEAVKMARIIGATRVIPCHYDMFVFNTADPKAFIEEAEKENQGYTVLKNGERWSS